MRREYVGELGTVYSMIERAHSILVHIIRDANRCAWDGDGTLFVADLKGGAIYSFPANSRFPGPLAATRVAEVRPQISA